MIEKRTIHEYEVNKGINQIIRQIAVDKWNPELVVGMTRGGLGIGVMLSHYYDIPFLPLNKGDSLLNFEFKEILLVDDINDTGAQLNKLFNEVPGVSYEWVRPAVLYNNKGSSFDRVKYFGYEIDKRVDPAWIVFPWETWWNYEY